MGYFVKDFSLVYCIMEKYTESKEDTQPLFSAPAKKTRRGEKCADFGCLYEYIQQ